MKFIELRHGTDRYTYERKQIKRVEYVYIESDKTLDGEPISAHSDIRIILKDMTTDAYQYKSSIVAEQEYINIMKQLDSEYGKI